MSRRHHRGSDQVCDFGPGSGRNGGHLVGQGTPKQLARTASSVTGPYLSNKQKRFLFQAKDVRPTKVGSSCVREGEQSSQCGPRYSAGMLERHHWTQRQRQKHAGA